MKYEVDEGYRFEIDEEGVRILPEGLSKDGSLYVLPNGKYLPRGLYKTPDGGSLIYEPRQLSPFAELLSSCTEE